MDFNEYSHLEGKHAFLSASKYHWVNYDEDKLVNTYTNFLAAQQGTRLHNYAAESILLGIRLPHSRKTLNMYINDAIGYRMKPEQVLFYSDNCFGTADAISFRKGLLRIHDLKTGVTATSMTQLEVYAALFCLEYNIKPKDIKIQLRIYQMDKVIVHEPPQEDIMYIIEKIVNFDKRIEILKTEV